MARDQAYRKAEKKIEAARRSGAKELNLSGIRLPELPESLGQLTQLQSLNLSSNQLMALPESLGQLTQLQSLDLHSNQLTALPKSLGQLTQLQSLNLFYNKLTALPESLGQLTLLQKLELSYNQLKVLPESLGQLTQLQSLNLSYNQLTALPEALGNLTQLQSLNLSNNKVTDLPGSVIRLEYFYKVVYYNDSIEKNPLNPELAEAYKQGPDAVKAYLRAKAAAQITLNEAKLILVGEGEVGKSCLLGALRGDPWEEDRPTTHGIEIKPVKVTDPDSKKEITLNGWDFGGQRVYRPTHQLFFSAPAVYLVVWKPREGPQQGFVKEWIQLVKRREPSAKIIVVATHGGPQQRQPDIDRQELWDLFGKETVVDFFFVDSKPDEHGNRKGIAELTRAIARVAATLPEVGRSVPKSFADVRQALQAKGVPYLPLDEVLAICRGHNMDDEIARLFIIISHRLGHLTHYENDPALRDIVILRPDWLATAMSYVLDDEVTRKDNHGLVSFDRLRQLWNDPKREPESRYAPELHPLFLRLMERFDLSYKVALPDEATDAIGFWQQFKGTLNQVFSGEKKLDGLRYTSLIGQLVPDVRPVHDLAKVWTDNLATGDLQQTQICRIVDKQTGQTATAEGLFYQLIVRLHKYSLGRANYNDSVHWQRGLVLDNAYNGRAFLEHKGNDIHITVRAPYPERFLAMLTEEVKYLVESFWPGLRCDVTVPCLNPKPCLGLFEVAKLIENKRRNRPEQPCPICNEWQSINQLLLNAPDARPVSTIQFVSDSAVLDEVRGLRRLLLAHHRRDMDRLDQLEAKDKEILSKIDVSYYGLMQALTDEAKEGPRLFSLVPVDRTNFNPREWTSAKFRLTLWCEHSRLPLPSLDGKDSKKGVIEIELTRGWFKKAAPFLKVLTGTLSLVLPVAASGVKLAMDDAAYDAIDEQLDFGKDVIDASLEGSEKISDWLGGSESTALEHGEAIRAQGATLRELHALLKAKDPGFGGLVRVMNKRQEFLWVHPMFEKEY
jgi:GTPase SAR1 family protein